MADKIRVYSLTTGDYAGVVFEDITGILEWIKGDLESSMSVIGDEFQYDIEIKEMTREEIDNLPEIA